MAPSVSAAFGRLLHRAEADGIDRDALCRLFWLLNAHPRLLGHQRCLQNLLSLLSTPEFKDGVQHWASSWVSDIPAWTSASRWAVHHLVNASGLEEFLRAPQNAHHHVLMRHGINRHPTAGALWIRHHSDSDPSLATASLTAPGRMFRLLQWHLFCSQAEARQGRSTIEQYLQYDQPNEWPAWPRPAAAAGLALRQLSYSQWDALLEELPFEARLDDFANALCEIRDQLLSRYNGPKIRQRIVALASYFEDFKLYFKGQPNKRRRRGGGSGGGRTGIPGFVHFAASPLILFEPPEPESGDEDVPTRDTTRVHMHSEELTPQAVAELEEMGVAPGEDLRPIMDLFAIEDRPGGIHSLWTMRQATDAAAHGHYWDKTQLTPVEMSALLSTLGTARPADMASDIKEKHEAARLVLWCMLIFGCNLDDARSIRTLTSTHLDALARSEEGLATRLVLVDADTGRCDGMALPVISPRYASRPPSSFSQNAHATCPYLKLPDTTGLGESLLLHQHQTGGHVGGPVFIEARDQLEVQIDRLLEAANRQLDTLSRSRVTTTKVTRKLAGLLARAGLDEVGVAITCVDRRYESQARLHYTQHRADFLANAYAKAVHRLLKESRRPCPIACQMDQPERNGVVGARLIITQAQLSRFIGNLQSELHRTPRLTRSGRQRYHRAFLLYTLLMQGLLTGIRPSSHPERPLEQMLTQEGQHSGKSFTMSLVEKDDQYEAGARPVAIPGRLKRQLEHVLAHDQGTWRWWPIELSIPPVSPAQRMFLDWVEDRGKPTAHVIDAKWMAGQLAQFGLPAAANFTRAFTRTWLLRDGCAEQVIDAFLGHAGLGQSPTSMHGTFDFRHHLREIADRIERMADELGLQPVRSKLAELEASLSGCTPTGASP